MKTNQETLDFGIGNKQYKAIKDWSGGFSSVWVGSSVPCPGARQPSGELQERRQLTQLHWYSADMGTKVCHLRVKYGS